MEVEILSFSEEPTSSGVQQTQVNEVRDMKRAGCPSITDFEAKVRAVTTRQRVTAGCRAPEQQERPSRREDRVF